MTTLKLIAQTFLTLAILLSANVVARADDSAVENVAPSENRWAIFIDASNCSSDPNDSNNKNYAALVEFRNALVQLGIPEKNALIYSDLSTDERKRPTRETIEKLVDALRRPRKELVLPGEEQERRFRENDDVCEVLVFLTGLGVANEETDEAFIAPSDVDEAQIKGYDDPQLFPLKELEDALLFADGVQKSIERTFLVVALNSPKETSRDSSNKNVPRLKGVDPKRIPRGAVNAASGSKFAHFRVATKNARFDDAMVGSFYQTLRDGLDGAADVVGDQNGTVGAEELASYLETTARDAGKTVAVVHSGNDPYPLCMTSRKPTVPSEIFEKLVKTFDNPTYVREREEAAKRARNLRAKERGNAVVPKKGDANK